MDTFTINEKLLASDFTPNQAKGATAVIAESASDERSAAKADMAKLETKLESDTAGMATKLDIAELKSELKTDIAELRSELKTDIAELKTGIAELKAQAAIWLFAAAGLIIAAVGFFSK